MELNCDRVQFASAFQSAASAVPSRTPKDILRNVYMQVTEGQVALVGTDQEIAIRAVVDGVETGSVGDVLLPTGRMLQILREMQDERFTIHVEESLLTVKSATAKFRLSTENAREYPPVPEFSDADFFRIPAAVFRQMIRRTVFATDIESTRYALGGVLIDFGDEQVTMAATDSRRLAIASAAFEKVGTPEVPDKSTVIPTKAMNLADRATDGDAETVEIALHENDVLIRAGGTVIYSRLVEGRFPRYRDVVPPSGQVTVELPVGPFYAAVRQSQIVTDEETKGVEFIFDDSALCLTSKAQDIGDSRIELPISFEGERVSIIFDPRYVSDFLKVLPTEEAVSLQLEDGDHPGVFRVGDSYTYVIMPLSPDH